MNCILHKNDKEMLEMTNEKESVQNRENKDQHNQDKTELAEDFFEQRIMEDLSSRNNDPDSFWMTLLKNNESSQGYVLFAFLCCFWPYLYS